jgi:protein-tyrosine phosphatase
MTRPHTRRPGHMSAHDQTVQSGLQNLAPTADDRLSTGMTPATHITPRIPDRRRGAREAIARPARDHASGVIDLHCHLLPGIDDGPADMATALTMARMHVAAGVDTVAATPHVSWSQRTAPETIARGVSELRAALAAAHIPLNVVGGAEIDVQQAAELPDEQLRALALGGGPWLLVEAPLQQSALIEPIVGDLLARGHAVLLAHPERSPVLHRNPAVLERMVQRGVRTQITASSLGGRFGRTVQRFTEHLLDEGLAHVVASDAHDVRGRPPGIREALVAAGLDDLAPLLTEDVPGAILRGEPLPLVPPRPARRRSRLRGLLRGPSAA